MKNPDLSTMSLDSLVREARLRLVAANEAGNNDDVPAQHRLVDEAEVFQAEIRGRAPDGWRAFLPLLTDDEEAVRLVAAGEVVDYEPALAIATLQDLNAHAGATVSLMANMELSIMRRNGKLVDTPG